MKIIFAIWRPGREVWRMNYKVTCNKNIEYFEYDPEYIDVDARSFSHIGTLPLGIRFSRHCTGLRLTYFPSFQFSSIVSFPLAQVKFIIFLSSAFLLCLILAKHNVKANSKFSDARCQNLSYIEVSKQTTNVLLRLFC